MCTTWWCRTYNVPSWYFCTGKNHFIYYDSKKLLTFHITYCKLTIYINVNACSFRMRRGTYLYWESLVYSVMWIHNYSACITMCKCQVHFYVYGSKLFHRVVFNKRKFLHFYNTKLIFEIICLKTRFPK